MIKDINIRFIKGIIFNLAMLISHATYASPIAVGLGSFSGSETILTFDGISEDQLITGVIGINNLRFENITAVPLPSSFILFLSGLVPFYRYGAVI